MNTARAAQKTMHNEKPTWRYILTTHAACFRAGQRAFADRPLFPLQQQQQQQQQQRERRTLFRL